MLYILPFMLFFTAISAKTSRSSSTTKQDYAAACYSSSLPTLTPNSENRTIPWGSPSLTLPNGTQCCSSLDQVRAGIDEVDDKLLSLLALRAGYVREASRFKATLDSVDVPSRDEAVIEGAAAAANGTHPPLPETIARIVFTAILNSSVPFEECIYEEFYDER